MTDRSFLFREPTGEWRWRRIAPNHEIVAGSTEGYLHRLDAVSNYRRINGADAPTLEDLSEDAE